MVVSCSSPKVDNKSVWAYNILIELINGAYMDFLKTAQAYAEARGDDMWFRHYYTLYRQQFSVRESVRKTLAWLYDDEVAAVLQESAMVKG